MSDGHGDNKLHKVLGWVVVLSVAAFSLTAVIILIRAGFRPGPHSDLYFAILQDHFVAVVGLPLAAVAALFVVLILRSTQGPIEFGAAGLSFKGASGSIVLWLLCFLGIALAIKLLW